METMQGIDTIHRTIETQKTVLILAKTRTCSVCNVAESRLEPILAKHPHVAAYRVYIEDEERFRGDALVFSVPTVIVYHEGREQLRESRFINTTKIERLLEMVK